MEKGRLGVIPDFLHVRNLGYKSLYLIKLASFLPFMSTGLADKVIGAILLRHHPIVLAIAFLAADYIRSDLDIVFEEELGRVGGFFRRKDGHEAFDWEFLMALEIRAADVAVRVEILILDFSREPLRDTLRANWAGTREKKLVNEVSTDETR